MIATTWQALVFPASLPFGSVVEAVILATGLAVTFYPMFYVFPGVELTWREVVPGVAFAAVG